MKQSTKYFLLLLLLVVSVSPSCTSSVSTARTDIKPTTAAVLEDTVPAIERNWQSIYFRGIDERLVGTDIPQLRDQAVSSDEIQVRIWAGFSTLSLRGLLLSRERNNSSATFLRPRPDDSSSACIRKLPKPKDGWQAFWNAFDSKGIASLEDSNDIAKIDEGSSVVVEIRDTGQYRAYHYPGVFEEKGGNYARLSKFSAYINEQFGIDLLWEPMPSGREVCHE